MTYQKQVLLNRRSITITTDVTNESEVHELMQKTTMLFGRIDLVVTCAGIGRGGAIKTLAASDMQMMMNINFMGTYHCVQAALPTMRQQQSGHFIFLSSVAGKFGVPLLSGYSASKWAVRGFSSALRSELQGSGIGITTVYPAWVDTPMVKQEENSLNMMDIVVMLTPDQVASDILQAVINDQRDLTLAPNPDIALYFKYTKMILRKQKSSLVKHTSEEFTLPANKEPSRVHNNETNAPYTHSYRSWPWKYWLES